MVRFYGMLALLALSGVVRADGGPAVGTKLDASTASQAEKLLPPEILKHYQTGDYVNPIVEWPDSKYTWPADFLAASKQNEGKFKVAPEGHVVDKTTGTQPSSILGFPFPTIDEKDPTAGSQVVWNYLYRTWYFGNLQAESQINLVSQKALERRLDVTANFMYFDGVPKDELPANSGNFLVKFLTVVRSPADVNGTAALTWRYRDPTKRDSSWAYVPALRRVRAVSPANRSDGFLGSDLAQDDGTFFEGKPEDFTWKLTGETDQLRLADPINLQGKSRNDWHPRGGWNAMWDDIPFIGYMDPNWKGAGWAPNTAALANRRFWVVEGVPKDRYYLFGKLQLYIDKTAFQGSWNRKFDWKGEILNTYQVLAYNPQEIKRPDGKTDYVQGSNMAFQTAEAIRGNRATVAGIKSAPDSLFLVRSRFEDAVFDLDKLAQSGK
jgi:Protein of unknown function (DUF1329)